MAYEYESREVRHLRQLQSKNYNQDLVRNISGLNNSMDYVTQYMITMQKGIDEANKDIIQKIQDFIEEIIIIFSGGEDTGFEFGDLKYILQALGALFGFNGNGPVDLLEAAGHFLGNFLQPLGLLGDIVNGFIQSVFQFFASLLSNIPVIGDTLEDIVTNVAGSVNETNSTATGAATTAGNAHSIATSTAATVSGYGTAITNAQSQASNAASVAAAALQQAEFAYDYASHREKEFAVTSSGLQYGSNEQPLGALIVFPPGAACKIERLVYTAKTNTASSVTVQLIRRALDGGETVAHTTVITGGAVTFPDNTIAYNANDLDHYYCNLPVNGIVGGAVTALHCCIEYFIFDPEA